MCKHASKAPPPPPPTSFPLLHKTEHYPQLTSRPANASLESTAFSGASGPISS